MDRDRIEEWLEAAVYDESREHMTKRFLRHGRGATTRHETLGLLTEEFQEAVDAIRNDDDWTPVPGRASRRGHRRPPRGDEHGRQRRRHRPRDPKAKGTGT